MVPVVILILRRVVVPDDVGTRVDIRGHSDIRSAHGRHGDGCLRARSCIRRVFVVYSLRT